MVSDKIINWIGKYLFLMGLIMYINKRWSSAIDLLTFLVAPFAPDNNYMEIKYIQLIYVRNVWLIDILFVHSCYFLVQST